MLGGRDKDPPANHTSLKFWPTSHTFFLTLLLRIRAVRKRASTWPRREATQVSAGEGVETLSRPWTVVSVGVGFCL